MASDVAVIPFGQVSGRLDEVHEVHGVGGSSAFASAIRELDHTDVSYQIGTFRQPTRASIASQMRAGVSVPLKRSIATMPVGEVTLISVR